MKVYPRLNYLLTSENQYTKVNEMKWDYSVDEAYTISYLYTLIKIQELY